MSHRVADVDLAGRGHSPVVHVPEEDAGGDAELFAAARPSSAAQSRRARSLRPWRRGPRRAEPASPALRPGNALPGGVPKELVELGSNGVVGCREACHARKDSGKVEVSTVIPWRCRATSSQRTVLKAVVRAPMAPTTIRRMPRTTLDPIPVIDVLREPRCRGWTVWGFRAVKGTPYWQKTSMTENLPQKASRRSAGAMWSISSG